MQLAKIPRGREGARPLDASPVPHPHGPGHEYTHPHESEVAAVGREWIGWKVTDELGRAVGRVEGTAGSEWLVVRDRRGRHLLAPAHEAIGGGASVFLPYEADVISSAPRLGPEPNPDASTSRAAREHYARA